MQMYDRVHIVEDTKETLGTDYAVSHYLLASFIFSSLCNTQEQSPLCKTTSVTSYTPRSLVSKSAFSYPGTLFANVSTECCSHHQGESEEV